MNEPALIRSILARVGAERPDVRLFRNVSTLARVGKQRIMCGLALGSADLIGIGPKGRFISLEVKTGKQYPSERQRNWQKMVTDMGGLAAVVRSADEALKALEEA